MDGPSEAPQARPEVSRALVEIAYARAEDVRRDRLPDSPRGILARSPAPLRSGDAVDVRIEIARERVSVAARGLVRWATPLARGSLVGLDLQGVAHRDGVKLDLLFGIRTAGAPDEPLAAYAPAERAQLSVAMLQPNPVLRQAIAYALQRYARECGAVEALRIDTLDDARSFVASIAARRPDLAVIDCDDIPDRADPLLEEVRSAEPSRRLPAILLSSLRPARLEDPDTVTMRKPVGMRAFLHTADLLLRGGPPRGGSRDVARPVP